MNSSFSARVAAYFGGLFIATIGILFVLWFFGLPQLGIVGAESRWLTESTHALETIANYQRAALANSLEERRGDLLVLSENKIIAQQMAINAPSLQQEAERVFDRLVRAYPDRFQEILLLEVPTGKILA